MKWIKASERLPSILTTVNCKYKGVPKALRLEHDDTHIYFRTVEMGSTGYDRYSVDFIEWLDETPSLPVEENGWVRVEDGLPENGYCIVSYFNPSDKAKKYYVITLYRSRGNWYYDSLEKEPAEDSTLKVTHWRNLPAPPLPADK